MQAEVISIGDELTSGQRLDTNSQWLSQRLGELGIAVIYHTTVADDLEANLRVFRQAAERADVVISTGGLGPTADDLTRDVLARLMAVELVLHEPSLAHIRRLFASRGYQMPPRNEIQARFPAGSRPIPNPEGTAPGIALEVPRPGTVACRLFALPGVPDEMRQMWQQTVAPLLAATGGTGRVIRHRRIKCFGVGESALEQMLPDLIRRGRQPSVGITVSEATITLRITATGATAAQCDAAMEPTAAEIYDCLGSLVFGEEDDELQHAVIRLLRQRGFSLVTAEWGTAGLVADWLGDVPDTAGYYLGGLVVPSETALVKALGVPAELVARHGGASGEVVEAMAASCRSRFGADYALSVGRFPDVDPADTGNPDSGPPKIFFALADHAGVKVQSATFAAHSAILKPRAAKQALNLVRKQLLAGAEAMRD